MRSRPLSEQLLHARDLGADQLELGRLGRDLLLEARVLAPRAGRRAAAVIERRPSRTARCAANSSRWVAITRATVGVAAQRLERRPGRPDAPHRPARPRAGRRVGAERQVLVLEHAVLGAGAHVLERHQRIAGADLAARRGRGSRGRSRPRGAGSVLRLPSGLTTPGATAALASGASQAHRPPPPKNRSTTSQPSSRWRRVAARKPWSRRPAGLGAARRGREDAGSERRRQGRRLSSRSLAASRGGAHEAPPRSRAAGRSGLAAGLARHAARRCAARRPASCAGPRRAARRPRPRPWRRTGAGRRSAAWPGGG